MLRKYERTYAKVDLDRIRENLIAIGKHTGKPMLAVVKADAYGHGAVRVAEASEDLVYGFGVATAEEAIELRKAGIQKPILVLGTVPEAYYPDLIRLDVRLTLFERAKLEAFSRAASEIGKTGLYHIKVDTGMSRIGLIPGEESIKTVLSFREIPQVEAEGIFTHLACADIEDEAPTAKQLALFSDFVGRLKEQGMLFPLIHSENSAAGILYPEEPLSNLTRVGISMYGLLPSEDADFSAVPVKPALSLYSEVSFVKTVPAGTAVSYGGHFVSTRETRVATVSIGYADGYARSLSGVGEVMIRGRRVPIIGRICMDQLMADVSTVPEAAEGDLVTLIGRDGGEEITLSELGERSGRFNYEFACCLTKRVPRLYVRNGQEA